MVQDIVLGELVEGTGEVLEVVSVERYAKKFISKVFSSRVQTPNRYYIVLGHSPAVLQSPDPMGEVLFQLF